MTRSLKPTLRRWRRDLEPVVIDLPNLAETSPEAEGQMLIHANRIARMTGRPVLVVTSARLFLGDPA